MNTQSIPLFSCFLQLSFLLLRVTPQEFPDTCQPARCGKNGPLIRCPFRLTTQPNYCGIPGFEIFCSPGNNHTLIKLNLTASSVQVRVRSIDYHSRAIDVSDPGPGSCLPKYARNFSSSFNKKHTTFLYQRPENDIAVISCPAANSSLTADMEESKVACLSKPGTYDVYALPADMDMFQWLGCTKMYDVRNVPGALFMSDEITLYWDGHSCPKDHKGTWRAMKVAGSILGSLVLLGLLTALYREYRADKKEKESQKRIEKFLEDYRALKPARYTYADLMRITGEFKEKLGQGAYGTVYKGKLSSEISVAVKMLNHTTGDGEDFINEVGTMGRIYHINVVRLVGLCADGSRRALVYEFLPNESLEKFIFSDDGHQHYLGWEKLQGIALGIARGIEYLHQGCDQRILHFDIKPHNILLDNDLTPKITDFGLAKLCAKGQSAVSMTAARGTMGYIAPEVFSRNFGNVSYKSDVYSFGMLLLEMVGGRKNHDDKVDKQSQVFFPEWIYNQLELGQELALRVEEGGDSRIAKKLTIVALCCIQWYPVNRPSMNVVVQMLEGNGEDLTIPPNPFKGGGHNGSYGGVANRHHGEQLEIILETE